MFEARDGEVSGVSKIRRQVPVEDYLRPQRRFAHLFEPEPRTEVDRPHPGGRGPQHPPLRPAREPEDAPAHSDGRR